MSDAKKAKTEGPTTRELDRTGVYPELSSPNTQRWPSHTSFTPRPPSPHRPNQLDRTGVYPGLSSPNTLTPPFTHAFPSHTDPTNQKRLRMRRRWLLRLQL